MTQLTVEGVSAGYGNLQIITDVSLSAAKGEVTVIVGPNGSGKSTLLKTIAGLTRIYQGRVITDGATISGLPPHEIARRGLAYLPQTESTFTELTVAENFRMAGYTVGQQDYRSHIEESMKYFPRLSQYLDSKVRGLSGGERQMVAMTMALIRKPTVMMFDEPTANLAPIVAKQVLETISLLAHDRGMTVLLVEQNARRALEMGDKAYLLVGGRKAFEGRPSELLAHQELAKLYLGLKVSGS